MQSLGSVGDDEAGSRSDARRRSSPMTEPIRGELMPADLPELRLPGSRRRGHGSGFHVRDVGDATEGPSDWNRHPLEPNRDDIEPVDFLFEHHPKPVARRFPIAVSIAIVMSPLMLYFALRFAVGSIPQEYFADVKRMAVQRANHDGGSPFGPAITDDESAGDLSSPQHTTNEKRMLIRGVCLGGNGRYLATYHAPMRPGTAGSFVRVEDLQERKVIGELMIEGPRLSLAASMDTLVVGGWGSASLQSFRLPSLQRIHHRLVPPDTAPISLAMGHASQGPLYVINAMSRLEVRDVATLAEISHVGKLDEARLLFDKRSLCNASADGSVFCAQGSHLNVVHYVLGRFRGEGQSTVFASDHVAPTLSHDGQHIFTPRGVYSSSLVIADVRHRSCLAAASGPYFVGPSARTKSELNKLWLYAQDHDAPIAEIPKAIASPLAVARNSFAQESLTNDKRLILIPSQNCIVTIAPGSDQTVVHDFKFDEIARRAGVRVPRVTSLPTQRVRPGGMFRYQVDVRGVQEPDYRLSLAPPGMQIDTEGLVQWKCNQPAGFVHPVVIDVRDDASNDQSSASQSFHLTVGGPLVAPLSARSDGATPTRQTTRFRDTPPPIAQALSQRQSSPDQIRRVDLPGIVRQPTVAGEGRFLVVRLVEIDSLAVIDLLNPTSVRYLPITPTSIFAASKSSVILCDLAKQTLERFDLMTLRSAAKAPFPSPESSPKLMLIPEELRRNQPQDHLKDSVARSLMRDGEFETSAVDRVQMSMGSMIDGPLLYCDRDQGFFIDPDTLKPVGEASLRPDCTALLSSRWGFRMLPDGRQFVGIYDYETPTELRGGSFDGSTILYHTPLTHPSGTSETYPGMIFVEDSFYAAVAKKVVMGIDADRGEHLAVPSVDQNGYVAVEMRESPFSTRQTTDVFRYGDDEFHRPTARKKLVTLSRADLEPPPTDRREYRGFLPWHRRLIHIPHLRLLVTLPAVGNRIVVVPLSQTSDHYATWPQGSIPQVKRASSKATPDGSGGKG